MRSKQIFRLLCPILIFVLTLGFLPHEAAYCEYTVDEVNSLIDGIVDFKLNQSGSASIDEWLDGAGAEGAGKTTDWYVIAFSQYGYGNLSAYEKSLTDYLADNNVASAVSRERYALALCASGSRNSYISDILDSSIGKQGVMSLIFGLHILNNGYSCADFTVASVTDSILSTQLSDGGWALYGENSDIDVTAMAVQSLAPQYSENQAVSDSVDRALEFLSEHQKENGGYESMGAVNPESAAQVLTAVSALGIDCRYDERFIKNGSCIIDAIAEYRLSDSSFSHTAGGSSSETATVQALYSLIAFKRMTEGKSPFFTFDRPQMQETPQADGNSSEQHETPEKGDNREVQTTAAISSTSGSKTVTSTASAKTTSVKSTRSSSVTDSDSSTSARTSKSTDIAAKGDASHNDGGYKPIAVIVIIGSAAVIAIIIFILGKRNYKNFIFIGIIAGIGTAAVLLTDIKSADEYYSGEKKTKENAVGSITMEIRCDTVSGRTNPEFIPDDGIILPPTAFDIEEGETVFDILTEAAQTYGIQLENNGSSQEMAYIAGINYLYEFDFGDLSGWVYHVNGIATSTGCGEYELKDGDRVEWLYTCELGNDLNEVYEK